MGTLVSFLWSNSSIYFLKNCVKNLVQWRKFLNNIRLQYWRISKQNIDYRFHVWYHIYKINSIKFMLNINHLHFIRKIQIPKMLRKNSYKFHVLKKLFFMETQLNLKLYMMRSAWKSIKSINHYLEVFGNNVYGFYYI